MVISFGETLWDLFPTGEVMGGAPANLAYRLHSLGVQTLLVSRVGRDDLGRRALQTLRQSGLNTDYIQIDPIFATGSVEVEVGADGSPSFRIIPTVAYDYIDATPALLDLAQDARCICFGTLVQRTVRSRSTLYQMLAAGRNALKVCDLNLRRDCFTETSVAAALHAADILKLNDDEANYLVETFSLTATTPLDIARAALEKWNLRCCVITRGAAGAVAASEDETCEIPAMPTTVVDTCGAGDAFTAGFLFQYLRGADLRPACLFGNTLGSIVASQPGATTPISSQYLSRLIEDAE